MYDITKKKWHCFREFNTNRGINSVAIHPKLDMIAIGGGKTAQEAALKSGEGHYDVLLYSTIFEEQMGRLETDNYSPLNSMTFSNDGSYFVLGYEEGQVRVFSMDPDFEDTYKKKQNSLLIDKSLDSDSEIDEYL